MNKQEEIKEGVKEICDRWRRLWVHDWDTETSYPYLTMESEILSYLNNNDVAIATIPTEGEDLTGCCIVRIEPLIKEKK